MTEKYRRIKADHVSLFVCGWCFREKVSKTRYLVLTGPANGDLSRATVICNACFGQVNAKGGGHAGRSG